MSKINIVHLYAKEMNIYGDNGNILVLQKRLSWRGFNSSVIKIGVGDKLPNNTHIIVGGGGQDSGQATISKDLISKSSDLKSMCNDGIPMILICGMYQMFGNYFKTNTGMIIDGIGVLDIITIGGDKRIIGNICSKTEFGELVGYENHSGLTYLQGTTKALGITKTKQGNNGKDKTEGARFNNVYGTYLHGPVLAKAPVFADQLINKALLSAGIETNNLPSLDDSLESLAKNSAIKRPR